MAADLDTGETPALSAVTELVVCSLEPWDEVWRRNQYFVDHLLRAEPSLRVLFVEPPVDTWQQPSLDLVRWRSAVPESVEGYDRLWRLAPFKPLPRLAGPLADRWIRRQVTSAAAGLGLDRPVLWINDLQFVSLVRSTGWPSLYDVTDDWLVESSVPKRVRHRRARLEETALREVDEVVVCSPGLAASRGRTREVTLVPNGVDLDLMRTPQPRPADLGEAPVAVYVGTLHDERLDVPLLLELATEKPELTIDLVGPDALRPETRMALSGYSNVRVLGSKPHRAVAGYLQHADAVIVPHLINEFTESLDPIKAYEALAIRTPTVSTPVAGFRGLEPAITIVPGRAFAAAVQDAVEAPRRSGEPDPRISWSSRASAFDAALGAASVRAVRGVRTR